MKPAAEVIAWCMAAGVSPERMNKDAAEALRFCVHEAFHAMDLGIKRDGKTPLGARLGKPWHTDAIHARISEARRAKRIRTEVDARAAEWLALEAYGLTTTEEGADLWSPDLMHLVRYAGHRADAWAFTSFREAHGTRSALPTNVDAMILRAYRGAKAARPDCAGKRLRSIVDAILECRTQRSARKVVT